MNGPVIIDEPFLYFEFFVGATRQDMQDYMKRLERSGLFGEVRLATTHEVEAWSSS